MPTNRSHPHPLRLDLDDDLYHRLDLERARTGTPANSIIRASLGYVFEHASVFGRVMKLAEADRVRTAMMGGPRSKEKR